MKLSTPLVASMGALLLVGALFLSLFLSTAAYSPGDIVTPSEATDPPASEEIAGRNLEIVGGVTIDAENIQRVIASLSRARQLYRDRDQPPVLWRDLGGAYLPPGRQTGCVPRRLIDGFGRGGNHGTAVPGRVLCMAQRGGNLLSGGARRFHDRSGCNAAHI